MVAILADVSKFKWLGSLNEFDYTAQNEIKLQSCLLYLVKSNDLPKTVYKVIRPLGSQRPKMYGFPKIQNRDVPRCPFFSMIGSAKHELAKFFATLLQSVLKLYSINSLIVPFLLLK